MDEVSFAGGTNPSGDQQVFSFDAFGKRRNTDWTNNNSDSRFDENHWTERGYTGHEHLDNVRMIHMNGRVQEPIWGRMLSPDPVVGDLNMPQTLNAYTYVASNPLTLTDLSGREIDPRLVEEMLLDDLVVRTYVDCVYLGTCVLPEDFNWGGVQIDLGSPFDAGSAPAAPSDQTPDPSNTDPSDSQDQNKKDSDGEEKADQRPDPCDSGSSYTDRSQRAANILGFGGAGGAATGMWYGMQEAAQTGASRLAFLEVGKLAMAGVAVGAALMVPFEVGFFALTMPSSVAPGTCTP